MASSPFDRLIGDALNSEAGATSRRIDELNRATAIRRARLEGYRSAARDDSDVPGNTNPDFDAYTRMVLDPFGSIAYDQGRADYTDDATASKSGAQELGDTALAGVNAVGTGILSGAAIISGVAGARDMALELSDGSASLDRKNRSLRSYASTQLNRAQNARNEASSESHDELRRQEIEKYRGIVGPTGTTAAGQAALRKVGRDFLSWFLNADSQVGTEVSGDAIGSMLLAGAAGRALGAGAQALARPLAKAGMSTGLISPFSTRAAKAYDALVPGSVAASIGLQEGSGAYTQAANDALASLADRDDLTDDEKRSIANRAGLFAAAVQGPIGAATGTLVAKFEGNPLDHSGSMFGNILREVLEEGTQGATGQLASNYAVKREADPTRDILDGVGASAAEGAAAAFGSTALIHAPISAGRTAKKLTKGAANLAVSGARGAANYLERRSRQVYRDLQDAAPLSLGQIREQIGKVRANAGELSTRLRANISSSSVEDRAKVDADNYVGDLVKAADSFDEIERLTSAIENADSEDAIIENASALKELLHSNEGILLRERPEALDESSLDSDTLSMLDAHEKAVLRAIKSQPVIDALNKTSDTLESSPAVVRDNTVTPTAAKKVALQAEADPLKTDSNSIDIVLKQNDDGKLILTPREKAQLLAARALLDASTAAAEVGDSVGITDAAATVSKQITTGSRAEGKKGKLSGVEHMRGIIGAMRAGRTDEAKARLQLLSNFAQSMQNKLQGANEALKVPGSKQRSYKYQAHNGGSFYDADFNYTPGASRSVGLIQQIAVEAAAIGHLANRAAELFPELGIKPIELANLDPRLVGDKNDIADAFTNGTENDRIEPAEKQTGSTTEVADTTQPEGGDQTTETNPFGHAKNRARVERAMNLVKDFLENNPEDTQALKDNINKVEVHIVGGTVDPTRNSVERGDLDIVVNDGVENGRIDPEFARALDRLKNAINDGNTDMQAMEGTPDGKATSLDITQTIRDMINDASNNQVKQEQVTETAEQSSPKTVEPEQPQASEQPATAESGPVTKRGRELANTARLLVAGNDNDSVPNSVRNTDAAYNTAKEGIALKEAVKTALGAYEADPTAILYRALEVAVNRYEAFKDENLEAMKEYVQRMEAEARAEDRAEAEAEDARHRQAEAEFRDGQLAVGESIEITPEALMDEQASEPTKLNLFQGLVKAAENQFKKAFKVGKNSNSRLMGLENPFVDVYNALDSQTAAEEFIGSKLKANFSQVLSSKYQEIISQTAEKLQTELERRINEALDKPGGDGKTKRQHLLDGTRPVERNDDSRLFNLLVQEGDELKLHPQLTQAAMLAAVQWAIDVNNQNGALSEDAAAAIMGVRPEEVDARLRNKLTGAQTLLQVTDALTQKIKSYWGLQSNRGHFIGYTTGIPEALAKEMIDMLTEPVLDKDGLDKRTKKPPVYVFPKGQAPITQSQEMLAAMVDGQTIFRTPYLYRSNILKDNFKDSARDVKRNPIRSLPDMIDRVVLKVRDNRIHIGEKPKSVARYQLRNPLVPLSSKQVAALENEGNTPRKLDMPMANLYNGIGPQGTLILHGDPDVETRPMNTNDRESVMGRNRVITAGWAAFRDLVDQMKNYSEATGVALADVPVYRDYEFSSVNRMQEQGDQNPQANKLMREIELPTHATLDLTKAEHRTAFFLALGQAFGVKVHTQSFDATEKDVRAFRAKLPQTRKIIADWLESKKPPTEAQLRTIRNEFAQTDPKKLPIMTPVQLHALVDMARAEGLSDVERKAFKTSLYLEADGVTNGPVNAINLFDSGPFTESGIENRRRGGLFIGSGGATTTNEYRSGKTIDLYQVAANGLTKELQRKLASDSTSDIVKTGMKQMGRLMATLGMGIDRNLLKNPLTITVYGSGPAGIAGKIANEIFEKSYQLYSKAAQRMADNPGMSAAEAMFGDVASTPEEAQRMLERFQSALNDLTGQKIVTFKGRDQLVKTKGETTKNGTLEKPTLDLTFTTEAYEAMQANLLKLLVEPMVSVIGDVMGTVTLTNTTNIRKATQAQSIIAGALFRQLVQAKLTEYKKDPNYRKGEMLTQNDLDEINKEVIRQLPFVKQNGLSFYIAHKASTQIRAKEDSGNDEKTYTALSRTLSGDLKTRPRVPGPQNAKVAGIPYLTIGLGDGMMMVVLATMDGRPEGTLKVFDGMHMKLDSVFSDAPKVNQAAHQAWQGNPLRAVAESFRESQKAILETIYSLTQNEREDFARALDVNPDALAVLGALDSLQDQLDKAANDLDAKQKVLAGLQLSVDQMAGAAAPYTQTGEDIGYMDAADQAVVLQDRLDAVNPQPKVNAPAAPLQESKPAAKPTARSNSGQFIAKGGVREASDLIGKLGRLNKASGARVLSLTSTKQFLRLVRMTSKQRAIMDDILKIVGTNGYKIVYGSREQVVAWQKQNGRKEVILGMNDHGATHAGDKIIYLVNPRPETVIHELIHAATFEKVLAHYNGNYSQAVANVEKLMNEFLDLDMASADQRSMRNAVMGWLAQGNKAAALNEFMAWTLSNPELQEKAEKTTTNVQIKTPTVGFFNKVVEAIKKLVWGKKAPDVNQVEMFDNLQTNVFKVLRFNTAVIMASEQSEATDFTDTVLYQSDTYGRSERLTYLNQVFNNTVGRYLHHYSEPEAKAARVSEAKEAALLSKRVTDLFATHFNMDMQERTTFQIMLRTMGTGVKLSGNSLARAQQLFDHVQKNLKPQDFMPAESTDVTRDEYYANQKYNAVMGKFKDQARTDPQGRTTLLASFIALGTVNEEFRSVLRKMDLPTKTELGGDTLDAKLENFGTRTMEEIAQYLSGEKRGSKDVQVALDGLMNQITEVAAERKSFMEKALSPLASITNKANDLFVGGVEMGAEWVANKTDAALQNNPQGIAKTALQFANQAAKLMDQNTMEEVSQGILVRMHRAGVLEPLNSFLSDIVGRNNFNAGILDLVKPVRAGIARIREQYRTQIPKTVASKFKRTMEDRDWTALYKGIGKTDLASLVTAGKLSWENVRELVTNDGKLEALVRSLEDTVKAEDPTHFDLLIKKSKQLAEYNNTGAVPTNLLRNGYAISKLHGEISSKVHTARGEPSEALQRAISQLVTLYSVQSLDQVTKTRLTLLALEEAEGFDFSLAYTVGQRIDETRKAALMAKSNHYKGYIPGLNKSGVSLVVRPISEDTELTLRGYVRVADYDGSSLDTSAEPMAYYFAPVSAKAQFNQGIVQNIHDTAGGVDVVTGQTVSPMTAGIIRDPVELERIARNMKNERGTERLLPIYTDGGELVGAERSVDPVQLERLESSTNLADMLGVWHGRQFEEQLAQEFNKKLIDEAFKYLQADKKGQPDDYYDLFKPESIKDPVIRDAAKLITPGVLAYAEEVFGDQFLIPKVLAKDFLGYRSATIGDAWTGNTRWNPKITKQVRDTAIAVFGKDAYAKLVNAEKFLQNAVTDARMTIVVRSVFVPMINIISNMLQLIARGVPYSAVFKGLPGKLAEVNTYVTTNQELMNLEAELRAVENNPLEAGKFEARIQTIKDLHKSLSIWPLIEAGELAAISDVGLSKEEIELSSGRLNAYIEKLVDKLPDSIKTAGKYAWITRDTALFKGLQRAVEYGDFLAKAVYYDDLTKRQKKSHKEAMGIVSQEYVNYDILPGRFRSYLESVGLLWFWNFKIRSIKIAASMIRNNPVHSLLTMILPHPEMFGEVGSPLEDNLLSVSTDGRLSYSMGTDMLWRAPSLNPWWNMIT